MAGIICIVFGKKLRYDERRVRIRGIFADNATDPVQNSDRTANLKAIVPIPV